MTPTAKEIMATFIARDVADGEEVFVGTNLPVIRAAANNRLGLEVIPASAAKPRRGRWARLRT